VLGLLPRSFPADWDPKRVLIPLVSSLSGAPAPPSPRSSEGTRVPWISFHFSYRGICGKFVCISACICGRMCWCISLHTCCSICCVFGVFHVGARALVCHTVAHISYLIIEGYRSCACPLVCPGLGMIIVCTFVPFCCEFWSLVCRISLKHPSLFGRSEKLDVILDKGINDSNVVVAFRRPRPEWLSQQSFVIQVGILLIAFPCLIGLSVWNWI
jgi:hypothetical protein